MTVNVYTYYSNRIALGEVCARYSREEVPAPQAAPTPMVPLGVVLGLALGAGVSIATLCVSPGFLALNLAAGAGVGAGAARLGTWLKARRPHS